MVKKEKRNWWKDINAKDDQSDGEKKIKEGWREGINMNTEKVEENVKIVVTV